MLLEFTVENFLSFKERTTFSMVASKDKKEQQNLISFNKINVLKSAAIYGANASGKTNLINAIILVNNLVRNSHKNQQGDEIKELVPFKLDETYTRRPSSFEVIFVKEGIKYTYGFVADKYKIYDEYLYYYPQNRIAKVFERHNVNDYKFTTDKREQNELAKRTLDNCLYLSTSANWNYAKTKAAFEWFAEQLRGASKVGLGYTANLWSEGKKEVTNSIREFIVQSDISILDLDITIRDISEETIPKEIPDEIRKFLLKEGGKTTEIKTFHLGKDKEGNENKIKFDLDEESEGTIKMFGFAGPFTDVLNNGRILIIDELDTKLHPLLTKYLVELFNNSNKNEKGAQLIFTAHDTNLLRGRIFRRDQIWFTSKRRDQSTELYSLYDYKARNDEDVEKRYLAGRYGAIPILF